MLSKRVDHALFVVGLVAALLTASLTPLVVVGQGSVPHPVGESVERLNRLPDPTGSVYVSPNANENVANGSFEAPYRSINTALAAANPGDTIVLRGGRYTEGINVRPRKANITIKSHQGEWAIIDLTTYNSGHDEDSGVYFDVDSSGGKLQGVEVIGGFYAVCMETKWDWGDPQDRLGASNIVIEDCILHDSRHDVIKVKPNCNNITVQNCEIYNSGTAFGGAIGNAEGIDNVNGNDMVVLNNYIHDICSNGIYAKGGARDAIIEGNRLQRCGEAGILIGFDTSPEFFDLTVNPKYYENIRATVANNLIIDTGLSGIGLYAAKDAKVYNNTLVNVANGGLYHSAIYFGVSFQDWENDDGCPATINPQIYNNIITQPATFVRPMVEIRYANELGGLSALEGSPIMYNNCYYLAGGTAAFSDSRPGSSINRVNLSAWQVHIGGDSDSIEVDPMLNANFIATNPLCLEMGIAASSLPIHPIHPIHPRPLGEGYVIMQMGSPVVMQGELLLPPPPQAPQIINGRTMLPFRYLVQTVLGGEVDYDAATEVITAQIGSSQVVMTVGDPEILVDGTLYDYGQAPVVVNGSTLVPLRAFEALVSDIEWNPISQTVTIVP